MSRPRDRRWLHRAEVLLVLSAAMIIGGLLASRLSNNASATPPMHLANGVAAAFNPHVPTAYADGAAVSGVNTDSCGLCHRAHTAASPALLATSGPESQLCFTCHDGTGSVNNVAGEYSAVTSGTPNNVATASFYTHDASYAGSPSTPHLLGSTDEFGGILNRHSDCGDCHNPHAASGSTPALTNSTGWTPSYRLTGVSGVSAAYSGSNITFNFIDGKSASISKEYQVCFKCHSSYTKLTPNSSGLASRDMNLDAAAEFNPANASFHPVEAMGTNQTLAMANSLAGGTRWQFQTTDTVRCTNCHANGAIATSAFAAPGSNLPPHASSYRGILLRNYEDRVLPQASVAYDATDFTLCYLCHADSPFVPGGTNDSATNFKSGGTDLHRLHVSGLANSGGNSGTSIDNPGDGSGNALCAECHFRPHSTAFPTNAQTSNTHLVSFSPNVQAFGPGNTSPIFVSSANGGSCALLCHGHEHSGETYP